MITANQTQKIAPVQAYMHLSDEEISFFRLAFAMGEFMLDDSKEWFYWSECTIDNAYTALFDGISRLVIDEDLKQSLLNLEVCPCSDLAFSVLAYAQLVISHANTDLVRSCLNLLQVRNLKLDPNFSDCTLDLALLRKYEETYQLLPHMKSVLILIKDIRISA